MINLADKTRPTGKSELEIGNYEYLVNYEYPLVIVIKPGFNFTEPLLKEVSYYRIISHPAQFLSLFMKFFVLQNS